MKNIDKIRAVSAEELAKIITSRACNCCDCKPESDECYQSHCTNEVSKWLEQEYIEPMPELQLGDILRFRFKDDIRMHTASVVGEGYMYSSDSGYGLTETSDSHYKILEVWRFNGERLKTIWRADDEKH